MDFKNNINYHCKLRRYAVCLLFIIAMLMNSTIVSCDRKMPISNTFQGKTIEPKSQALRYAMNIFDSEIRNNIVRITQDERGIVISLVSDTFFSLASDQINYEATKDILQRLCNYLSSKELTGMNFRVEGHTDNIYTIDPWELTVGQAMSILDSLIELGVDEKRFEVSAFGDTRPVANNDTPEGRAYNRRVEVIVLDPGNL